MSTNLQKTGSSATPLILPLPGNEIFARQLAEAGGWEIGTIETRRFPDGETYVRLLSDVADRPVCLVARSHGPMTTSYGSSLPRMLSAPLEHARSR